MSIETRSDTITAAHTRIVSAFFDAPDAVKKAVDDLVAAGVPRDAITQTDGDTAADPVTATAPAGEQKGFWESLKDLFLPDEDRASYAEGLRRGGFLVSVRADDAQYDRVLDILDNDGAVDIDEREGQWRSEGWTGLGNASAPRIDDRAVQGLSADALAGDMSGMHGGVSASAPGAAAAPGTAPASAVTGPDSNYETDTAARAAALGTYTAAENRQRIGQRDLTHGRSRLRSYLVPSSETSEGEATPFSAQTDAARITEHMEVISADGQTIGTVDHLDGPARIKLAKNTSPDHQHHYVPFAWIDHVDQHVHLKRTLADIKAHASIVS